MVQHENFYKTPSDAYKALVGVYDGLQRAGTSGLGMAVVATEVMSDNCFGGAGNADGFGIQMMDELTNSGRLPTRTCLVITGTYIIRLFTEPICS